MIPAHTRARVRTRSIFLAALLVTLITLPARAEPQDGPKEARHSHWVRSGKFWASFALVSAAAYADAATTQSAIRRGASEDNPLFGSHPSMGHMMAINEPMAFVSAWSADRISKQGGKMASAWFVFPSAAAGLHILAAAHNTTLHVCPANDTCK